MLLFNIDKKMFEAPADNGGSSSETGTTDPNPTLESVMSGADTEITQKETGSETGSKEGGNGESAPEQPAWMQQLPKEMRTDDLGKFKQISDVVNAYKELAEKQGQQSQAPGKDAKPEEIQAYYERLGKPKTAEEYSLKGLDGDEAGTKLFKEAAYKANLTDQQATDVFETFNEIAKQEAAAVQAAMKKQYDDTDKALHEKYGSKYNEKLTLLQNGMRNYVSPELQQALSQKGLLFNQDIVNMLITLGEASSESGSTQKGDPAGKTYKSVNEGGMFTFKE